MFGRAEDDGWALSHGGASPPCRTVAVFDVLHELTSVFCVLAT